MTDPQRCGLCGTEVDPYLHDVVPGRMSLEAPFSAHRECLLRSAVGGIGHLRDHAFWCLQQHDPDGGMSFRESALAVDDWVAQHGVQAAVEAGTPDATTPPPGTEHGGGAGSRGPQYR